MGAWGVDIGCDEVLYPEGSIMVFFRMQKYATKPAFGPIIDTIKKRFFFAFLKPAF